MKILVIGGTGSVGSQVIQQLVRRGANVRALVRNNESASKLPKEVEPVIGDLLDPVAVQVGLDGVDKLYLLNAVAPDELTQGLIVYVLAKRLKLKQVVYHSVFRAEHFPDVPHFASKLMIENAIKTFDVPFTIIHSPQLLFQERRFPEGRDDGRGHLPHAAWYARHLGGGRPRHRRGVRHRADNGWASG